ncbi:hypothetical protein AC578_9629 [Pseudocercospora eumusae]|uniref:Uncharacterized protein n=1 Tax=Pseudocercospora eumusae TaxID=321146 RepID=A0A139H192_9PEZI|nr:hypothetical protein AC578_9629 [Pseudocercospora eumusae]
MSNPLPQIVLLELTSRTDRAARYYAYVINRYSGQADVRLITTPQGASAFFQLDAPQHPVVHVSNSFLESPELDILAPQAAKFVREGGSFVFSNPPMTGQARKNFRTLFEAFSLPWDFGWYCGTECVLNPDCTAIRKENLTPKYRMKAVKLRNVKREDKVYVPSAEALQPRLVHAFGETINLADDPDEVPIAVAEVGAGKVGYIGDINADIGDLIGDTSADYVESGAVLRAMLGLN